MTLDLLSALSLTAFLAAVVLFGDWIGHGFPLN